MRKPETRWYFTIAAQGHYAHIRVFALFRHVHNDDHVAVALLGTLRLFEMLTDGNLGAQAILPSSRRMPPAIRADGVWRETDDLEASRRGLTTLSGRGAEAMGGI